MVDHNDRDQAPDDDLYDETVPRSIFAATWFRAVLVLIVVGVIGAVAFPYIHDAMNAPPKLSAGAKPEPAPLKPPPPVSPPAAVTPPTPAPATPPSTAAPTPAPPAPPPAATSASATTTPPTPPATEKPVAEKPAERAGDKPVDKADKVADKKDAMPVESAKAESTAASKPAAKSTAKAAAASPKSASRGQWFVQVGAFKDASTAKKVADKLREDKYQVDESLRGGGAATVAKATTAEPTPSGGSDQYDVIISGESPAEVNKRLQSRGLVAEATANGAIVKPSLPLRDAVALSKDLAVDGLKVQVRRAGGAASAPTPRASSPAASASGGDTLHRVSVGGFADRATAVATLKELEGKGYKPFLTRR
jgi:cell division protein FtsN